MYGCERTEIQGNTKLKKKGSRMLNRIPTENCVRHIKFGVTYYQICIQKI